MASPGPDSSSPDPRPSRSGILPATADAVIVGAGLAGAATAWQLARRGLRRLVVVEEESRPGVHSSGRSAAMIRQLVPAEPIAQLARESRTLIAALAEAEAAETPGRESLFDRRGSLLTARGEGTGALRRMAASAGRVGLEVELIGRDEAIERVPALRGSDLELAAHTPSDGTIDVSALLRLYLRQAEEQGTEVHYATGFHSLDLERGRIAAAYAGHERIATPCIVNAAGPWASEVSRRAGLQRDLVPYRRHLARAELGDWRASPASADWPFVWDVSEGAYFRPVDGPPGTFLICACDHSPDRPHDVAADATVGAQLEKKLARVFPALGPYELRELWAGLRTQAADGLFVLGPDPELAGFIWAAGLGGHGVTTSAAVGVAAAASVVGESWALAPHFSPSRPALRPAPAASSA